MEKTGIVQLNYRPNATRMFVALACNMLNDELVAGVPTVEVDEDGQVTIKQLYGHEPNTSGQLLIVTHFRDDLWHFNYDGEDEAAILTVEDMPKWFDGSYGN